MGKDKTTKKMKMTVLNASEYSFRERCRYLIAIGSDQNIYFWNLDSGCWMLYKRSYI